MAAGGDDRPRTQEPQSGPSAEESQLGSARLDRPLPGNLDRMARLARPGSRTWWVLPYCAGALAVFVVAGIIIGVHTSLANGSASSASPSSTAEPMPAEVFPDTLFAQLTSDIQAKNETAFLGLASAAARPALTTWWENLQAIGFTTGAVVPTANIDAVHIDSHGDGTAVVLAGAHSPFDPVDNNGKPYVPMAHYQIGLHFASPSAIGQITSWQPLDDAPWDQGPLYVRKAANVVVAGASGDRALVDQTLPVAQTAAAYDIKMLRNGAGSFLKQDGFVVFVSGSAAAGSRWFATVGQPQGWPPLLFGARVVQLPGPGVSAYAAVFRDQSSMVDAIADNSMGGARVVLLPGEQATARDETVTLVREFALAVQAAQDEELANGVPLNPVPSWTEEGFGVAVQSLYEANPNPLAYNFATLTAELRGLPRSYRSGSYPTSSDLFGPSATEDEDWGYVAASTYEYIDSRYNIPKMMVSAMVLSIPGHATPFANVFKSGTNANNLVFFGIHSIRLGWQPWLARV